MLFGWQLMTAEEEAQIMRGIQDGNVYGGPYHLLLHPTDKCNLDCFFCYTEDQRRIAAEMSWDVLHRTLSAAVGSGLRAVSFGGGGESMVYRHMKPLMEFIEDHKLVVDSVKTNGTAVTPELAASLMRSRLVRITVSLNETTPETYAEMNRCAPRLFDRAMAGIGNLVTAKNRYRTNSVIHVQIFGWKGNCRRLVEMVETALEPGPDLVYINTIDQLPAHQLMNDEEREIFKQQIREVLRRWPQRVRLNLAAEGLEQFGSETLHKVCPEAIEVPDMVKGDKRIEYCYIGWHGPTIAANGDVFPCCHFSTNPFKSLGNLNQASLDDIWRGERAKRYRNEMRHLLLSETDKSIDLKFTCFTEQMCKERVSCAFNYYLASPQFYEAMHDWANSGPRRLYRLKRKVRIMARDTINRSRQLVGLAKQAGKSIP